MDIDEQRFEDEEQSESKEMPPEASLGAALAEPSLVDDLSCPICMSLLRDPFATACGHTFCYSCLTTHLAARSTCPSCGAYLIKDNMFPNFMLSKLVARAAAAEARAKQPLAKQLEAEIRSEGCGLTLADVNGLLQCLWEKKEAMEHAQAEASLQLLLQFLHHARTDKTRKLKALQEELCTLDADIHQVEGATAAEVSGSLGAGARSGSAADLLRKRLREAEEPVLDSAAPLAVPGNEGPAQLKAAEGVPAALLRLHEQAEPSCSGNMLPPAPQHLLTSPLPPLPPSAGHQPLAQPPLSASGPFPHSSDRPPLLPGASSLMPPPSPPAFGLPGPPVPAGAPPASGFHSSGGRPPGLPQPGAPSGPALLAAALPRVASEELPNMASSGAPPHGGRPAFLVGHYLHHHHSAASQSNAAAGTSASEVPSTTSNTTGGTTNSISLDRSERAGSGQLLGHLGRGHHQGGSRLQSLSSDQDVARTEADILRSRKRRVVSQFDDLQACYLSLRRGSAPGELTADSGAPAGNGFAHGPAAADADAGAAPADAQQPRPPDQASGNGGAGGSVAGAAAGADGSQNRQLVGRGERPVGGVLEGNGFAEFSRMLSVFTHCSKLKVIAELPRASPRQSAAILSSIEFDRDGSVFATAGVSKRISLFDFANVLAHPHVLQHCPAAEMVTRSKLSCLSWNRYVRPHLISSDYEGCVTLWDVEAGAQLAEYEAHDKRIWSVDFCAADLALFVSGSDDGFIKVWSTKQAAAAAAIDLRANVCCVKYGPGSAHHIAVGSADHNVHLYDLRAPSKALHVFGGHRKAVSYVRWLGEGEVVSASTDSTLRLWSARALAPVRTLAGHVNEKNFVGLSVDADFIACGSETNEVFAYYRALAKPIAKRLFSSPGAGGAASDGPQFISAVAWKPEARTLLAANSQGCIKVMQLTS